MIDCRNSRSVKDRVFELDIRRVYIYIRTRSSPGGHEEVRATKHQFVSTGSIRFHRLERALRDSATIAPTCIEWRKDVLVGRKDCHRGIKLLCVTAEREYSIIIHVFSPSSLWIHRAREILLRDDPRSTDELPIERHLWDYKKKINRCRGGDIRTDEIFFFISFLEAHSRTIFRAFDYYFSR